MSLAVVHRGKNMILEKFILREKTTFVDENEKKVVFNEGIRFGCSVDSEGNITYISENGDKYKSNDSNLPTKVIPNQVKVAKPTLFYVIDPMTKMIRETKYLQQGLILDKVDGGYTCVDFYGTSVFKCDNEENLEHIFVYPKVEVKAEAEDSNNEKKKFELNPNAKYCGDDGINAAILFLQTADLSKHIVRDDTSHTLFVDLGSAEMWTDIDNSDWIMKLNARIPLASACSVCKRIYKGQYRLAVILNSSFV